MILTKSKILAAALVTIAVAGSGLAQQSPEPGPANPAPAINSTPPLPPTPPPTPTTAVEPELLPLTPPSPTPAPVDRLDTVEQKLDRLLRAIEGPNQAQVRPTSPDGPPGINPPGSRNRAPFDLDAPARPFGKAEMPMTKAEMPMRPSALPTPPPSPPGLPSPGRIEAVERRLGSLEARIAAIERRLGEMSGGDAPKPETRNDTPN